MNRRNFIKLASIGLVATSTGCFGSFKATRWVYGINKNISGNKFVRWLVFLGLTILPVYEIAGFIDLLILNSIDFWFEGGATAQNETEPRVVQLENGETLTLRKDVAAGVLVAEIDRNGRRTAFEVQMGEDGARISHNGRVIGSALQTEDGGVDVLANGSLVARYDAATVNEVEGAYQSGGSTSVAQWVRESARSNRSVAFK